MIVEVPEQLITSAKGYLTNNDVTVVPCPLTFLKCKMTINTNTVKIFFFFVFTMCRALQLAQSMDYPILTFTQ